LESALAELKRYALENGPLLIRAILVLLIGVVVARLARRWLGKILGRTRVGDDPLLKSFFLRALSLTILSISLLVALNQLRLDLWTPLAGLGITGVIIGFALKDTLSNFASGLLLLVYRPFSAGEMIEVEGSQGVVRELTIVNTQIVTNDGVRVFLPNSRVWGAKITNYSLSERRRFELTIKVRDIDAEDAIRTIQSALAGDERILDEPAPSVRVTAMVDNAATLAIQAWTSPAHYDEAKGDEYLRLQAALTSAEIQLL